LDQSTLVELFNWSEAEWLNKTEGMALRRTGYNRWLRNLAVAMGNAPRNEAIRNALAGRITHEDETVREHVSWALERQQESANAV
jgi:epoxyqueuosine reductase